MSIFDTFTTADIIRTSENDNAIENPSQWTRRFAGTKQGKRLVNDLIENSYTIPYSEVVAFDDSEVVNTSKMRTVAGSEEKSSNSVDMINKANNSYLQSLLGYTKPITGPSMSQLLDGIPVTEKSIGALAKSILKSGIQQGDRVRGSEIVEFKSKQ